MHFELNRYQPYAIGALRIVAGLLYLEHGTQKAFGFPIPGPETLSGLAVASTMLELVGGALLILGLFTRPVAFVLSGHMAFAYFLGHFPKSFFPVANGGDASILFCFAFLALVTTGAGAFALDNRRK
ncbi:putative oxidoreductase [Pseudorhizobium tarimense]|uniref:Oxidoreductase n=1 Tax=Pseudorhizobium tarimense TaxID=1079109 RepID=A0ABV2H5N9_9HYPH|nr:DoxX family protein [Pseudorhizobium tarimense]MCJ8519056.1 DoxX family protein [Pseudorhizobium tarimense]